MTAFIQHNIRTPNATRRTHTQMLAFRIGTGPCGAKKGSHKHHTHGAVINTTHIHRAKKSRFGGFTNCCRINSRLVGSLLGFFTFEHWNVLNEFTYRCTFDYDNVARCGQCFFSDNVARDNATRKQAMPRFRYNGATANI